MNNLIRLSGEINYLGSYTTNSGMLIFEPGSTDLGRNIIFIKGNNVYRNEIKLDLLKIIDFNKEFNIKFKPNLVKILISGIIIPLYPSSKNQEIGMNSISEQLSGLSIQEIKNKTSHLANLFGFVNKIIFLKNIGWVLESPGFKFNYFKFNNPTSDIKNSQFRFIIYNHNFQINEYYDFNLSENNDVFFPKKSIQFGYLQLVIPEKLVIIPDLYKTSHNLDYEKLEKDFYITYFD